MQLRCSSLPMAFLCPGSVRTDEGILIDPFCDACETGTEVHRLLASHIEGDAPTELLGEISEDARILYFTGAKLWRETISAWMPDSEAETSYEDDEGTGHIDRECITDDGRVGVVLDWKSGRKDTDHKHQGFGYARRMFLKYPKLEVVTVHFCWLRTQELESYTVDRARSEEWAKLLRGQVLDWDGVYRPGGHCSGCRRFASCPALAEMNRASLALIMPGQTVNLATMGAPEMATLYRRLGPMVKAVESLQTAIKSEARARGGLDDGAGRRLYHKAVNAPREVDTLKAWSVLSERLTDEELAPCLKVKLGDVEASIAKKAGRGKGAQAKRDLAAALEAAGAVSQGTTERFVDERKE